MSQPIFSEYWSEFDAYVQRCGYPLATSPRARNRPFIRWSGLGHRFELAAHGPRRRRETGAWEISVELIRNSEGSVEVERHLKGWLPLVRIAWGEELDHHASEANQFKIDASTPAFLEDRSDWARQHAWLLSGVVRLDLIFRPILSSTISV